MNHRSRSIRDCGLPVFLVLAGHLLCTGTVVAQSGRSFIPQPATESATIDVGERTYMILGEQPVPFRLNGPGTFWGYARVGFGPDETGTHPATLIFNGIADRTIRIPLDFRPSKNDDAWGDGRPGRPSGGRKFEIHVPAGTWTVTLSGTRDEPGLLTAIVYYRGPAQPGTDAARSSAKSPSPWRIDRTAGIEFIYDNNILTMSPDYIDEFVYGLRPDRFRIATYDDLIIAPSLDISANRRFLDWGSTRFRFRVKYWRYTHNPLKTNTDFDWYVRQFFRGGKSLELNFTHSPEQYIRQLGDREPFSDTTLPLTQEAFCFTRNYATLQWRHYYNSAFSYSLILNHKRRYYNKRFMENDIKAWEFRGQVGYRVHRRLRLTFDYSFEPAKGRAVDTVGQTPQTSTASDPTHDRDLYRLGFFWTTRWARPVFDSVDGSLLIMDYYFTSNKTLFEDPYHVGRRDVMTRVTVRVRRRLTPTMRIYASFRYSDRVVDSPWPGDITMDKDYTQQRYWVGIDYQF
jgi:hypothetical protein